VSRWAVMGVTVACAQSATNAGAEFIAEK